MSDGARGGEQPREGTAPAALVTGATRGLGLEVVRQLAGLGFTVLMGARDEAKVRSLISAMGLEGVHPLALDVADADAPRRRAADVRARFGGCDVLVNNAGIHYDSHQTASTADFRVVREAFETNLFGAWRTAAAFVPLMREGGYGRVVNVSSEAGSLAGMGASTPAYAASKAALNAFTRLLAAELRGTGILVNSVCPGWTATDMGGAGGRPVADGTEEIVWAATLPPDGPTGGFFRDGKPLPW